MILEKIDQDLLALAKQSDNDLKYIYAQVDELWTCWKYERI